MLKATLLIMSIILTNQIANASCPVGVKFDNGLEWWFSKKQKAAIDRELSTANYIRVPADETKLGIVFTSGTDWRSKKVTDFDGRTRQVKSSVLMAGVETYLDGHQYATTNSDRSPPVSGVVMLGLSTQTIDQLIHEVTLNLPPCP